MACVLHGVDGCPVDVRKGSNKIRCYHGIVGGSIATTGAALRRIAPAASPASAPDGGRPPSLDAFLFGGDA
jgi:hypothetical protein